MKKRTGLVLSILLAIFLIAVPITVKVVLDGAFERSRADIGTSGATAHRIPVESGDSSIDGGEELSFFDEYMPEIAAGVSFLWIGSIVWFVGVKNRDEIA